MEAETLWSDLRRDLRRHLRELPDSSKSKARHGQWTVAFTGKPRKMAGEVQGKLILVDFGQFFLMKPSF